LDFFLKLVFCGCPRVCVENPVGRVNQYYRYPDQTIQPFQYAHPCTKATCLWLKGLPLLRAGRVVEPTSNFTQDMPNHKDRWKTRSRTFPGIAEAMAEQWG
jgi:hypothetical protein